MWIFDYQADKQLHNLQTNEYRRLENTESKLLALLLTKQGKTVTKAEIFAYVWPQKIVSEVSVTQTISKLRQSLSDNAHEQSVIRTIPKIGYCLMPNNVKLVADEIIEADNVITQPSISRITFGGFIFLLFTNILLFHFLFVAPDSAKPMNLELFTVGSNNFQVEKNDRVSNQLVEAIISKKNINNTNFYITSNQSRLYIACYKQVSDSNQQRSYNFSIDIKRDMEVVSNDVLEKCQ
ncbi:winged helix-turn-helix domain-containing protein [Vibrio aestuarianus]|uniref:winged helix-turn-helix domain-containing protein n=1 Tax=Vibrio aestuarianus TaxID=28171 RepID=UPI0021C45076|nr:winged helix-turn-helix domain-containing protein [Vibrio aestuarianus]MDE1211837.1 winged helix-turn-helix domain-containing protein [Vibrio aestuarianus]MDE1254957.1 winged helix-turn-helix domain-containing protein [Vibrio aestuarianus]MDE1319760.1 winged helix-turn-helix domain-containing protein [Vibrio aestuarianus]CAH8242232.1 Amidase [Vibrio aestuarianus]